MFISEKYINEVENCSASVSSYESPGKSKRPIIIFRKSREDTPDTPENIKPSNPITKESLYEMV